MGLYHPTAGNAEVLGLDPVRDAAAIHAQTGYLGAGELALHPHLTGAQHIDFAARARGMPDKAYLGELAERFGVVMDQPARALSKGNRQKIGIVLAFMHRPELLILDEPTSGLDPLMRDEFERLVRETAAGGRTVFLSSHELDEVQRLAGRVAIIKDGKLVVTDTVEHLRRSAPRTIEFRFAHDIDPGRFSAIDGVRVTSAGAGRVTLTLRGPVAPGLRVASELEPTTGRCWQGGACWWCWTTPVTLARSARSASSATSAAAGFMPLLPLLQSHDPALPAQLLTASTNVKQVGSATVAGVPTTEYSGTYTRAAGLAKLSPKLRSEYQPNGTGHPQGTVHFMVWVDGSYYMRKIVDNPGRDHVSVQLVVTSVNQPVTIKVPPASQVGTVPGL